MRPSREKICASELHRGQAAIFAVIFFLLISLVVGGAISFLGVAQLQVSQELLLGKHSYVTAESGLEDVIWRTRQRKVVAASEVILLNGATTVVTNTPAGNNIEFTSTADAESRFRRVKTTIVPGGTGVDFFYGIQVGYGGLEMGNNATVNGNVYSNGSITKITGTNGALITETAIVAGSASQAVGTENTTTSSGFLQRDTAARQDLMQSFVVPAGGLSQRVSLHVRKVGTGSSVNLPVRIAPDVGGVPGPQDIANGNLDKNLVGTTAGWVDVTFDPSPSPTASLAAGVTYWLIIDASNNSASNHYVFSGGPDSSYPAGTALYSQNYNTQPLVPVGGDIAFKVWVGSVNNGIESVAVGGDARAHYIEDTTVGGDVFAVDVNEVDVMGDVFAGTFDDGAIGGNATVNALSNCTVAGDAIYSTILNCPVGGVSTGGTPVVPPADPPLASLPVSDSNIADWKADAEAGGTCAPPICDASGNLYLDLASTASLGPMKIDGDVHIDNNSVLTLTGTLYITGHLRMDQGGTLQLDPGYGANSGLIITDDYIEFRQSSKIFGSGDPDSFLMMLSLDDSIDDANPAIRLWQGTDGAVFYAHSGLVRVGIGVTVRAVAGHQVRVHQNATVNYISGLQNVFFTSGPGGSWAIERWHETE